MSMHSHEIFKLQKELNFFKENSLCEIILGLWKNCKENTLVNFRKFP